MSTGLLPDFTCPWQSSRSSSPCSARRRVLRDFASDSDRESTATDSTRSTTRQRNNFPWVSVVRYSHKDHTQPEIASLLVEEADRIMQVAGDYIAKRPLDTDLGPFKRSHNVSAA